MTKGSARCCRSVECTERNAQVYLGKWHGEMQDAPGYQPGHGGVSNPAGLGWLRLEGGAWKGGSKSWSKIDQAGQECSILI